MITSPAVDSTHFMSRTFNADQSSGFSSFKLADSEAPKECSAVGKRPGSCKATVTMSAWARAFAGSLECHCQEPCLHWAAVTSPSNTNLRYHKAVNSEARPLPVRAVLVELTDSVRPPAGAGARRPGRLICLRRPGIRVPMPATGRQSSHDQISIKRIGEDMEDVP